MNYASCDTSSLPACYACIKIFYIIIIQNNKKLFYKII